ncbi:2Fe-2S iron-sulfur cluster-binding protein [Agarivorans sp. Toyoura001]|uniref:2Fe-2S iron-sulfur cluster-binding protein n=1 Tax=unclassified Agarivorans TaxID=2636026 RepID=UPI0010E06776|nr:2Fe-2S iron-sulfur cluster-binding protein [Agarivorans sp. Toyoura001]GDY27333.1 hypothetical protein AHAT_32230 [Agarivorans sp. Toyoura001]
MANCYRVSIAGKVFTVEPQQTILQAALSHGISWPYRCQQGGCCSCLARRTSGEIDYQGMAPMLSEREQAEGWFVACLASAKSDLSVSLEG